MTQRNGLSRACQDLTNVERALRQLVQAIKDGVPGVTIKDELALLESKRRS